MVAAVGAGSAAISAIIAGIFRVLESRSQRVSSKIVIQGSDGRKIEVPGDTPTERIEKLMQLAKDFQPSRIQINSP